MFSIAGRVAQLVALVCALTVSTAALAEKRVALVIGNSAYVNIPRLANPVKDARLMADTLKALGFALVGDGPQLDLDESGLRRVVQAFGAQLQGADVGVFYYAGHGIQVKGANYLVPVGANPTREADVSFQMLDTNLVLQQMEGAGTRLNVVILDACRNNPFGGRGLRSTGNGLAQITAPEGTLISFATQPGNVALDGEGSNSPYTTALAQTLRRPGLDIFQTFNEVGLAVKRATGDAQQPWVSSSPISGSFFFAGAPAAPPAAAATPTGLAPDEATWSFVKDTKDPDLLRRFIEQFPTSARRSEAAARLFALEQAKVAVVAPPVRPAQPSPAPAAGKSFRDCADCPEMVAIPAGEFMMGDMEGTFTKPVHRVRVSQPLAIGKYPVTRGEYARFVKATGYTTGSGCWTWTGQKFDTDSKWSWRNPGIPQTDRDPVVCVLWKDAKAYAAWLARTTGKDYRLLTSAEWEYAARAGTTTAYYWGDDLGRDNANCSGCGSRWDHKGTSPVGSFAPNRFGLYDMAGNVWQWVEDCWTEHYNKAPNDAAIALVSGGDCTKRVLRGGSYVDIPFFVRAGIPERIDSGGPTWSSNIGIRVMRTN